MTYRYRIHCTIEQVGKSRSLLLNNKVIEIPLSPNEISTRTFVAATNRGMSFLISPKYLTYITPIIHTKA